MSIEIEESSGNVFADLGFENPEMELNRAVLGLTLRDLIRDRGWTQATAGERLGIDQPKVSNIMRGRLSGFSVERLAALLERLDHEVLVTVRPKRAVQTAKRSAAGSNPEGQSAVRPPST